MLDTLDIIKYPSYPNFREWLILVYSVVLSFSGSVMSNSSQPHTLQHTRTPCPSQSPETCSNSCPLTQWGHPTISSTVVPFSSCLQSFPASESFPMSQFFASGGQSIGTSTSASALPINIQGLISFRTDWFDLLAVQRILKGLIQHHSLKASILQSSLWSNFRIHTWLLEKP